MVLGLQFQNAAVARFPDAVRELAIYALAQGTFGFFQAALNFMPQLSNVYAREECRLHSYLSDLAVGVIGGFGKTSYLLALEAAVIHCKQSAK